MPIKKQSQIIVLTALAVLGIVLSFSIIVQKSLYRYNYRKTYMTSPIISISASNNFNYDNSSRFDSDFAESISKPLPQWFQESKQEREKLLKEIIKNREKIILEFKAKYEISEQEKIREQQVKLDRIKKRLNEKSKKSASWTQQLFGLSSSTKQETQDAVNAEEILSTKENWDQFWEEEEKQTGFYLPGFFEVFPELKLKWPTWSKRRDGSAIECATDQDCPFPQACCPHPLIPGQKFCCTGFGQRIMVPAYAYQKAKANNLDSDSVEKQPENERENWRPSPDLNESPF